MMKTYMLSLLAAGAVLASFNASAFYNPAKLSPDRI